MDYFAGRVRTGFPERTLVSRRDRYASRVTPRTPTPPDERVVNRK